MGAGQAELQLVIAGLQREVRLRLQATAVGGIAVQVEVQAIAGDKVRVTGPEQVDRTTCDVPVGEDRVIVAADAGDGDVAGVRIDRDNEEGRLLGIVDPRTGRRWRVLVVPALLIVGKVTRVLAGFQATLIPISWPTLAAGGAADRRKATLRLDIAGAPDGELEGVGGRQDIAGAVGDDRRVDREPVVARVQNALREDRQAPPQGGDSIERRGTATSSPPPTAPSAPRNVSVTPARFTRAGSSASLNRTLIDGVKKTF